MLISENLYTISNENPEYPASERLFFLKKNNNWTLKYQAQMLVFFQFACFLKKSCLFLDLSRAENPAVTVKHTYLNEKSN